MAGSVAGVKRHEIKTHGQDWRADFPADNPRTRSTQLIRGGRDLVALTTMKRRTDVTKAWNKARVGKAA